MPATSSRSARRSEIYNRPRDTFVAAFVGSPAMNLVPAEIGDGRAVAMAGKLQIPLNGGGAKLSARGPVTLGIRSEDIRVGPAEAVEAKVHHIENHGVEQIITLRVDDQLFKATVPSTLALALDAPVRFSWNAEKLHVFDGQTGVSLAS